MLLATLLLFVAAGAGRAAEGATAATAGTLDEALRLRDADRPREALRLLESLRAADTSDVELARLTAETAAWAGRLRLAGRLYGGLAARGDSASLLGMAMVHAWQDELYRSAREYSELLESPALRARALLGLARVRLWQGRPWEARRLLADAEALGPTGREGERLKRDTDLEAAPRAFTSGRYLADSEGNVYSMTRAGLLGWPGRDMALEMSAGAGATLHGSSRYHLTRAELSAVARVGEMWTVAAAGAVEAARNKNSSRGLPVPPSGNSGTNPLRAQTVMSGLSERFSGSTWVRAETGAWRATLRAAREYVSETPELVERRIALSTAGLDGAWKPSRWMQFEGGGSLAQFNDDNSRGAWYAALRLRAAALRPIPGLGFVHRAFRDTRPGVPGNATHPYFSPARYRSDEAELSVEGTLWRRRLHFVGRASLGTQKVVRDPVGYPDPPLDTTRSFKLELDGRPMDRLTLALFLSHGNSAVQSPTGYEADLLKFQAAFAF
ncbi:MAG: hypothetical protein HZB25_02645 [Candidatus Eisenbacteria bacterium]|nr:hypothetical protein [Candidatus Eisenbacteria bacterium]